MEDKTQISNSGSSDRNEKTVVMSSNSKAENSTPKEQGNAPEGNPSNEKAQDTTPPNNSNSKTSEDFIKDSKSKKSSAPAVAAGIGAAIATGVAGVALGATNSDKINEVVGNAFGADETPPSPEDVPLAEASTTEEENSVQDLPEEDSFLTISETSEADLSEDSMSSLEISGADQEGNVYSVSFLDIDGDGEYDIQNVEFQTVDGVTISYTEYGDALDPTFMDDLVLAGNTDYVDCGFCDVQGVSMMDSYLYEIQPGDTLSEIAEANNTSVEHLMELNPQISDPDLIYSGNNLIVPDGDSFDFPVQEYPDSPELIPVETDTYWDPEGGDVIFDGPNETIGGGFEGGEGDYLPIDQNELPNGGLGSIDWESFYDNPVENPYTNELESIDFEAMETPQSYNEMDYGMEDFGLDESGMGFI
jgi:LysM repeat protein